MSRDNPIPSTSGNGPKRSKLQREMDLAEIARLDRRGWTQLQIGQKLGLSQTMVSSELRRLMKRYKEAQMEDIQAKVGRKVRILEDLIHEAYKAFDRSKKDAKKVVVEAYEGQSHNGSGPSTTTTITTEGRLPANEYLVTIMKAIKEAAELEGLLAEGKNVNNIAVSVAPNWDAMYGRPVPSQIVDPVEARIEGVQKVIENGSS